MALGQTAGCPRVKRAKNFMCSPRNRKYKLFPLVNRLVVPGLSRLSKSYVFKVYVPFSFKSEKSAQRGVFWDRYPADIRGSSARISKLRSGHSKCWKSKHLGADIHDPKARTSTTPRDFQKLRSEKLWAEFTFPILALKMSLLLQEVPAIAPCNCKITSDCDCFGALSFAPKQNPLLLAFQRTQLYSKHDGNAKHNYCAVAFILRLRPFFQVENVCKSKENGIRTGVVTMANHYS